MVQVDKSLCIGCGSCFGIHSNLFSQGSDGKAETIKQPETDEEHTEIQEAIEACPVSAISE